MSNALNNPSNINNATDIGDTSLDSQTLKELEKIGYGDDLFMHRLLRNYLSDSSKQIKKIETAIKQKQFGTVHDYCHALKGNSLSVGATQLASTIDAVGKLNTSTSSTEMVVMIELMKKEFALLTSAIEGYLKQPEAALKR